MTHSGTLASSYHLVETIDRRGRSKCARPFRVRDHPCPIDHSTKPLNFSPKPRIRSTIGIGNIERPAPAGRARADCSPNSYMPGKRARLRGRLGSARIALVTVVDEERDALLNAFGIGVNIPGKPYFVRELKEQHQYDIVTLQASDRSNLPAGEAVANLVEDFRPEYAFLIGTAGGVKGRDNLTLGDVVVADYVDYIELRKWLDGDDMPRRIPYDHPSLNLRDAYARPQSVTKEWVTRVPENIRPEPGTPKLLIGNIMAAEKIMGDPTKEEQKRILKEFGKALAVDTESVGFAREVFKARKYAHYNLQYLVIRGVSDDVNDVANQSLRERWRNYASATAVALAFVIVEKLLATTDQDFEDTSPASAEQERPR